ncbi:MAG: phosphatidate cytidylyltransferase [Bacteroidota bacterium]
MNETLKRAISGAVYILLIIATAYSVESFYVLFGIFLIITLFEFCRILKINFYFPIFIACVSYFLAIKYYWFKSSDLFLLGFTLLTSIALLKLLFNTSKVQLSSLEKYAYVLGYIIFPFILIAKIPFSGADFRPKIIISIFILIWTNDTFAYVVGKSIGKRKLFEKISPKKTIEGFLGGLFFSIIAGILISKFYFNPSEQHSVKSIFIWSVTAAIITLFSTLGDLIESKFKRLAGVKDSGNIMPGHGGMLDRLDSIIFVAPFIFLFYQILYYVS